MSAVKFSKTRRGGDALTYEGYGYVRKNGQPNVWRCRKQNICQATVKYIDGLVTPCGKLRHTHEPDEDTNVETEPQEQANMDDLVDYIIDGEETVVEPAVEPVVERTPTPVKPLPIRQKRAKTEHSYTPVPVGLRLRTSRLPRMQAVGSSASVQNGLPNEEFHPNDGSGPAGRTPTVKERISVASHSAQMAPVAARPDPYPARQYLSTVPVSTVEEERFLHYVGGVLGSAEPAYKKRYMQTIRCAIAKLDLEIADNEY